MDKTTKNFSDRKRLITRLFNYSHSVIRDRLEMHLVQSHITVDEKILTQFNLHCTNQEKLDEVYNALGSFLRNYLTRNDNRVQFLGLPNVPEKPQNTTKSPQ